MGGDKVGDIALIGNTKSIRQIERRAYIPSDAFDFPVFPLDGIVREPAAVRGRAKVGWVFKGEHRAAKNGRW